MVSEAEDVIVCCVDRMQKVISLVRTTLTDLKLAIDGTIIMSETLRDVLDNMYDAQIPKAWLKVFIPLKPSRVGLC